MCSFFLPKIYILSIRKILGWTCSFSPTGSTQNALLPRTCHLAVNKLLTGVSFAVIFVNFVRLISVTFSWWMQYGWILELRWNTRWRDWRVPRSTGKNCHTWKKIEVHTSYTCTCYDAYAEFRNGYCFYQKHKIKRIPNLVTSMLGVMPHSVFFFTDGN